MEEKERDDSEYRWHLFVKIFIKTGAVFKKKGKKKKTVVEVGVGRVG